ncbi:ATP-dependent zinc metalloprotease FTSH 8 [Colletotrichum tropicale]|nr:ATP-dependent zinc metalloprotease FTSH 8 [Colletotrichum tropicale]
MVDGQSVESIFPSCAAQISPTDEINVPKPCVKDDQDVYSTYGRTCSSKTLYLHIGRHNQPFWSEKPPADVHAAVEDDITRNLAFIVRKSGCILDRRKAINLMPDAYLGKSSDPRKSLELDSIVIQSPFLKAALTAILDGYPGVNFDLERSVMVAPFQPLVHRWDKFIAALTDDTYDEDSRKHLELLHGALGWEVEETFRMFRDLAKNRVMDFEHLWAMFEPGCTIRTSEGGYPVAAKFSYGQYDDERENFHLSCQVINWNGVSFGWERKTYTIPNFQNARQIASLPVFPLADEPASMFVTQELIERGRRFEKLHGVHYRTYDGLAVQGEYKDYKYREKVVRVNERVVIDNEAYEMFNPFDQISVYPIRDKESRKIGHARYLKYPVTSGEKDFAKVSLTDEQRIFCVPMVRGYALKTKRWIKLAVDSVRDINFNDKAFDSLVLPENYKKLLKAFVQSQLRFKNDFDDFVSGKGKGIIILLSGRPGTGKTLTVESVADLIQAPLYSLSAGDLGIDSSDVQSRLDEALQLAASWNAVLLIDECDVFLEARSTDNLERNELVSIFLRTIEYYEGVMFLTTNRLNAIDAAFHSRAHLSLEYPGLDISSRKEIWLGFLEKLDEMRRGSSARGHELDNEHIEKLAALDLNGRQIKNVLKTANLLACSEEGKLGFEHVKAVLEVLRYTFH